MKSRLTINILTECSHPNIVGLEESYFVNGKLWMLLEYCGAGKTSRGGCQLNSLRCSSWTIRQMLAPHEESQLCAIYQYPIAVFNIIVPSGNANSIDDL